MWPEKHWDLDAVSRLAGGILFSLACGIMLIAALNHGLKDWPKTDLQLVQFIVGSVSFQGVALLLVALLLRRERSSWRRAFGLSTDRWGRLLGQALSTGMMMLLAGMLLGWIIANLLAWFGVQPQLQTPVQMVQATPSLLRKLFYGAVAVLFVPCAEEVLFRGVLYSALREAGRPQLALWGTSIVFALAHANLVALLPLIVVALLLARLYEQTGNLFAPILAHSFFNAANFLLLLLVPPPPAAPAVL